MQSNLNKTKMEKTYLVNQPHCVCIGYLFISNLFIVDKFPITVS